MLSNQQGGIDYMFLSPGSINMISSCYHKHHPWSLTDHSSINAAFRLERITEGPGIFRAMTGLQARMDYDAEMRHLLCETLIESSGHSNEEKYEEMNRSLSILNLGKKLEANTITDWETKGLAIHLSLQKTKEEILPTPLTTNSANLLKL